MKKLLKLAGYPVLVSLVLFSITACSQDSPSDPGGENPYLGNDIVVTNQQVWMPNQFAKRISEGYTVYNGIHKISALVYVPVAPEFGYSFPVPLEGAWGESGDIDNGILDLVALENDIKDKLIKFDNGICEEPQCDGNNTCNFHFDCQHGCEEHQWYVMKRIFREWKNVKVNPANAMGNMVMLRIEPDTRSLAGIIERQMLSGTSNSLTMDTLIYVYVDKDCVITGDPDSGFIPGQYYYFSKNNIKLSLKKGFNVISRKETYYSYGEGSAHFSMELKNPIRDPKKYKWVAHLNYIF